MRLLGKIPKDCYLACSGGIDSMMLLNFLLQGRRNVTLLYFNHNTEHGNKAEEFLKKFSKDNNVNLITGKYTGNLTTEDSWRKARYEFLDKFQDKLICTAHHLNDNIETYLFSTIKGTPKFIPYSRNNIIRPLLLVSKSAILDYSVKYNLKWIDDPSNDEAFYSRNKLRNNVIPLLKEINPGLEKVFLNKCIEKYRKDNIF